MSTTTPADPNPTCPYCERTGMVGRDREFSKGKAATVFKCHNCNRTWRVPDPAETKPQGDAVRTTRRAPRST
jgi:transposase-like protein